jgi:HEAT repeat protein
VKHSRPFKTLIALFTVVTFLTTSVIWAPNSLAAAQAVGVPAPVASEVSIPYQTKLDPRIQFSIPQELGTLQYFKAGKGPMVVHLQTAHGHYQAQKQIQALLHHLDKQYGIRTLLVEGSAFKLEPSILNFFPEDAKLTQKVNDALTKQALVKGPELYLLDELNGKTNSVPQAYGIENLNAYRENGLSFVDVLKEKKKTEKFLVSMNEGIDRLAAAYLNDALRGFLKRLESFEKGQTPLDAWLSILRKEALKRLKLDLTQPGAQLDWPMLVRIFKVQELSSKFDKDAFVKERAEFLKVLKRFLPSSHVQIKQLLESEQASRQLPAPETGLLFENMVKALPRDFNYAVYPNVCYFVGRLLLQSELKAPELMQEAEQLSAKIADKLAKTQAEKDLLALLKDNRLLQKLFSLELTPADYEVILSRNGQRAKRNESDLKPSAIIKRLQDVERSALSVARVKDVKFQHVEELDQLFAAAMKFYAGVKERDGLMEQMIEKRLQETGAGKVAVITGGFHSEPFKNYFASKDYSYALITPRITGSDDKGHEAYVENMLNFAQRATGNVQRNASGSVALSVERSTLSASEATRELEFLSDPQVLSGNAYGINAAAVRTEVRKIVSSVAGRAATSRTIDQSLRPTAETIANIPAKSRSEKRLNESTEKTLLRDLKLVKIYSVLHFLSRVIGVLSFSFFIGPYLYSTLAKYFNGTIPGTIEFYFYIGLTGAFGIYFLLGAALANVVVHAIGDLFISPFEKQMKDRILGYDDLRVLPLWEKWLSKIPEIVIGSSTYYERHGVGMQDDIEKEEPIYGSSPEYDRLKAKIDDLKSRMAQPGEGKAESRSEARMTKNLGSLTEKQIMAFTAAQLAAITDAQYKALSGSKQEQWLDARANELMMQLVGGAATSRSEVRTVPRSVVDQLAADLTEIAKDERVETIFIMPDARYMGASRSEYATRYAGEEYEFHDVRAVAAGVRALRGSTKVQINLDASVVRDAARQDELKFILEHLLSIIAQMEYVNYPAQFRLKTVFVESGGFSGKAWPSKEIKMESVHVGPLEKAKDYGFGAFERRVYYRQITQNDLLRLESRSEVRAKLQSYFFAFSSEEKIGDSIHMENVWPEILEMTVLLSLYRGKNRQLLLNVWTNTPAVRGGQTDGITWELEGSETEILSVFQRLGEPAAKQRLQETIERDLMPGDFDWGNERDKAKLTPWVEKLFQGEIVPVERSRSEARATVNKRIQDLMNDTAVREAAKIYLAAYDRHISFTSRKVFPSEQQAQAEALQALEKARETLARSILRRIGTREFDQIVSRAAATVGPVEALRRALVAPLFDAKTRWEVLKDHPQTILGFQEQQDLANVLNYEKVSRSEARFTPEEEGILRRAMKDLETDWFDSFFIENAMSRRIAAVKILGESKDPRAVPALIGLLKDAAVRASAAEALTVIGTPAVPALTGALKDKSEIIRRVAPLLIEIITSEEKLRGLPPEIAEDISVTPRPRASYMEEVTESYSVVREPNPHYVALKSRIEELKGLISTAGEINAGVDIPVVQAGVGLTPGEEGIFRRAMQDLKFRWTDLFLWERETRRRMGAIKSLGAIENPAFVPELYNLLVKEEKEKGVKTDEWFAVAALLLQKGETRILETVMNSLTDDIPVVRERAARFLGDNHVASAVPALTLALKDSFVKSTAAEAIEKITGSNPLNRKGWIESHVVNPRWPVATVLASWGLGFMLEKMVFLASVKEGELYPKGLGVLLLTFGSIAAIYVAAAVVQNRIAGLDRLGQPLKTKREISARSEIRATEGEIQRGVKIFKGEVAAEPVRARVRPSTEADLRKNFIPDFSREERDRLVAIAVNNLARGVHVYSSAAAGAAARMPIIEAPAALHDLSVKIHGEEYLKEHEDKLESKAAVPVGEYEGRAYSFLGLMLADIAGLEKEVGAAVPNAKANKVLVMTHPDYQDELDNELYRNEFYGVPAGDVIRHDGKIGYQQDLGPKYYLNEASAEKVLKLRLDKETETPGEREQLRKKLEPVYRATLLKAEKVRKAIAEGKFGAVVHPTEKDPAGHLEFFNQMVSKGILLDMIDQGIETLSFRNIDNAAATYTEDFLVIYGYMLDKGLDAVIEVSRRGAGMKGGGWYIDDKGNHQIAEDPTIDATWQTVLDVLTKKGWARQVESRKKIIDEQTKKEKKWETLPFHVEGKLRAALQAGRTIPIEPTRLSFVREEIKSAEDLEKLIPAESDAKIAVFEDSDGKLHVIRKVTSADTSAINDAVAVFSLGYIMDCFLLPGQSREEFVDEMRAAKSDGTLLEIAERGRAHAPLLLDPKPSRDPKVIGLVKAEGNMWQTTGTVPDSTRVEAIVVKSTQDIDTQAFNQLALNAQVDALRDFRFLATKQWKGPVESYEANRRFFSALFKRVFDRSHFDREILKHTDLGKQEEKGAVTLRSTEAALKKFTEMKAEMKTQGTNIKVSDGFQIKNGGEIVLSPKDFRSGIGFFIGNNCVIDGIKVRFRLGGDNMVTILTDTSFAGPAGFELDLTLEHGDWIEIGPLTMPFVIDNLGDSRRKGLVFKEYEKFVDRNEKNKAFFIRQIVNSLALRSLGDPILFQNAQLVKEQIDEFERTHRSRSEVRGAQAWSANGSAFTYERMITEKEQEIDTLRRSIADAKTLEAKRLVPGYEARIRDAQGAVTGYQRQLFAAAIPEPEVLARLLAVAPLQSLYDVYRAARVVLPLDGAIQPSDMLRFFYGVPSQDQGPTMQNYVSAVGNLPAQNRGVLPAVNGARSKTPSEMSREPFLRLYVQQIVILLQMPRQFPRETILRNVYGVNVPAAEQKQSVRPAVNGMRTEPLLRHTDQVLFLAVFLRNLLTWADQKAAASNTPQLIAEAETLKDVLASLIAREPRLLKAPPRTQPQLMEAVRSEVRFRVKPSPSDERTPKKSGISILDRTGAYAGSFIIDIRQAAGKKTIYEILFSNEGKGPGKAQFTVTVDKLGFLKNVEGIQTVFTPGTAKKTPSAYASRAQKDKKTTAERFRDVQGDFEKFLRSKIGQRWSAELFDTSKPTAGAQGVSRAVPGANAPKARSEIRTEIVAEKVDQPLDDKPVITWSREELAGVPAAAAEGLQYWTRVLYTFAPADMQWVRAMAYIYRRSQMTFELVVAANLLKRMALELTPEQIRVLTAQDLAEVVSTLQTARADGLALPANESRGLDRYEQLETLTNSTDLLKIVLNKLKKIYEIETKRTQAELEGPASSRSELRRQAVEEFAAAGEVLNDTTGDLQVASGLLKRIGLEVTSTQIGQLAPQEIQEIIHSLGASVANGGSLARSVGSTGELARYEPWTLSTGNVPASLNGILAKLRTIQETGTSGAQTLSSITQVPLQSVFKTQDLEKLITPEEVTLIEHFYFSILPMQLRELIEAAGGRKAVLEVLRKIPGVTVSELAADIPETGVLDELFAPEASLTIPETIGRGLAASKTVTLTVTDLGGKVFLGENILARLAAENPRALFYLLKTYAVFTEQNEPPALLTVGSRDVLLRQIEDALVNRGSGLSGVEITERGALLQALKQGKILDVIEPAQGTNETQIINELAATTQGGIASLHLSADRLPGSLQGVHFAFNAKNLGARDLMVASVLAIVLKSAADLIHNVPDARIRAGLIGKFVTEHLPGVNAQAQGNAFVITQITMLAQEFAARAYIATKA